VKIDIPELLLHLRAEAAEGTDAGTAGQKGPVGRRWLERAAFRIYALVCSSPALYELSARVLRALQRASARGGRIGKGGTLRAKIAPPLAAWTEGRDAPPLAPRSFREQWREGRFG
jgi:L-lactate dehydrogenase complex protein LldF